MKIRKIYFIIFDQFELLDLSGPVSVFSTANALHSHSPFETLTISSAGGLIQSSAMISVESSPINEVCITHNDTVLVVGGNEHAITKASLDGELMTWLQESQGKAERLGSICSGTFILASAGLLNNKSCASHWSATDTLQKMHPSIRVHAEALYVNDGDLWTSAGVTTGIDMALEMVRQDVGNKLSNKVAKMMVVYAHRPGNQTQFSSLLKLQGKSDNQFSNLLSWIDSKLEHSLKVDELAAYMCMSERTFYRKFTAEFEITPSKYVEGVKLERAKTLLEENLSVSRVANAVGFKSVSAFRTCFEKKYKISPSVHRQLHRV